MVSYITKTYIIIIALQPLLFQLLGPENIVYYSAIILFAGLLIGTFTFYRLNFGNIAIFFVITLFFVFILNVITNFSSGMFIVLKNGLRSLSSFIPLIFFSLLLKDKNSFISYLAINTYALVLFVLFPNLFSIAFTGTPFNREASTEIMRNQGLFPGWHSLGHYCLLTIFLLHLYKAFVTSKSEKYFLNLNYLISCFLVIESGARTTYIGLFTFYFTWLALRRKFASVAILLTMVISFLIFSPNFQLMINDINPTQRSFSEMGSNRGLIWQVTLESFSNLPLSNKLFGTGDHFVDIYGRMRDTHNDYLSILIQWGIFGLVSFLLFYFCLIYRSFSLASSYIGKFFISALASVLLMNFVSNSYLTRISVAMIFWPTLLPIINKELFFHLINHNDDRFQLQPKVFVSQYHEP